MKRVRTSRPEAQQESRSNGSIQYNDRVNFDAKCEIVTHAVTIALTRGVIELPIP
jgi:hypothetical protein